MPSSEKRDQSTFSQSTLRQLRAHHNQSRRALLPYAIIGVVVTAIGVAVHLWVAADGCSWWAWAILLVAAWFGFVGDLINVIYLRRRPEVDKLPAPEAEQDQSHKQD